MHSIATQSASVQPTVNDVNADRGHIVHTLLKMTLEQHKWIMDLPDAFAIRAELNNIMPLLQGRTSKILNRNSDAIQEWSLQGVQELLMWLKAHQATKIQAEPILPRIPIGHGQFLTSKSPDIEFIMGRNGQITLAEVKNGRAGFYVQHGKLTQYGIAALLKQSLVGKPVNCVQLRWLGLDYPGERGVSMDCQTILREKKRKLTLKAADRWLRNNYNLTFKQVLASMKSETKLPKPRLV